MALLNAALGVDLTHQARLVDATGEPIEGSRAVSLAFHLSPTDDGSEAVHTAPVGSTPVANGYVSVRVDVPETVLAQDPLWVEYVVDGVGLEPRFALNTVPYAWRADVATTLPTGSTPTGECDREGEVLIDPATRGLSVCAAGTWSTIGFGTSVVVDGTAREYADGSYAASCLDYLQGFGGNTYSGATGSGYYRIDPDADGTPVEAWCDMETDGGGWTLCFAYDAATYDSTNWPSIAASRDKVLSKTWGIERLNETGSGQGNFCNQMTVSPGNTQMQAEITRVDDGSSVWRKTFELAEASFFTQTHSSRGADCLVSTDGSSRMLYANYTTPQNTYNSQIIGQCSGSAGSHSNITGSASSPNGIDGLIAFEGTASGYTATQDLSLHTNWYSNAGTGALYVNSNSPTVTKFGVSVPYASNSFGRSGASPGPGFCYDNCGYTNVQQGTLKQRIWVR